MLRTVVSLALFFALILPCFGQQGQKQVGMSVQEARKLMKEAWENRDRNPDLAIRLVMHVLRYYPDGFEVRLPEYLDDIWRTQGEEAYRRAVIEGQINRTLHPGEMARLTLGGFLAVTYLYKKDGRNSLFWLKQVLRRKPRSSAMLLYGVHIQSLIRQQGLPQKPELFVNGQSTKAVVEFSKQAALVALQELREALGLKVAYDAQKRRVVIKRGGREATLELEREWGLVNDEPKELSAAPYLKDSLIMVPVEVLAELVDGRAYWDEETKLVHLFFPPE